MRDPARPTSWPAACRCGWDDGGALRVHDLYDEEWPPIPRGNSHGWIRVTSDAGPDDYHECPECGEELLPEDVVLRLEG